MPKALVPITATPPQQVYFVRTGTSPNRRLIVIFVDTDGTPVPIAQAVY